MYTVIMAGGSGTRFWPQSREARPKQFLSIGGEEPLLRQTLERVAGPGGDLSRVLVVAGQRHRAQVEEVARRLPPENGIYEPVGRNTAAAIGYACVCIARRDPEAVVAVLPSDHVIHPAAAFRATLDAAAAAAASGEVVTIGIPPTRPETGYGYIARGEVLGAHGDHTAHRVDAFVEKPDAARASQYLEAGTYLWNAGMFIFKVGVMLDAIRAHMPQLARGLEELDAALAAADAAAIAEIYPRLPAQSIDYGVMERLDNVVVIPASFTWSDVGSWAALSDVVEPDAAGNVAQGDALLLDTEDAVIDARAGRLVAVVGCRGLVVVDTEDALLIIPKERTQEVRRVLDALRAEGRTDLL